MFSPTKLLQQAKKMKEDMDNVQSSLKSQEIETSSAGGAIKIKVNGQGDFLNLELDPEFLKEDANLVSQTILNAVQEAAQKAKAKAQESMKQVTAGLNIPGLPGMF